MFESIVDRFGSNYGITILSKDPWVVTFDNFLTDSEVNALIVTGTKNSEKFLQLIFQMLIIF